MKDSQKIYIRGNKDRSDEIRGILARLGATNYVSCDNDKCIYFINHENKISTTLIDSEVGQIIMDNYKEIKLPQQQWKNGDILINNNNDYALFKKYKDNDYFEAYFLLDKKQIIFDMTLSIGSYRRINEEEREQVSNMARPMFWMIASIL